MRGRGLRSGHLCFQDATGLETTSNQLLENGRRPLESAKPRKNRGPANPFYSVIILCSHRGFEGPQVSPCSFCLPWSCAVLRLWFLQGEQVQVGRDWVLLCSCAAFRRLKQWMLFHVMRDSAKAASKSQGLSAVTLPKGALQTRDVLSSQEQHMVTCLTS